MTEQEWGEIILSLPLYEICKKVGKKKEEVKEIIDNSPYLTKIYKSSLRHINVSRYCANYSIKKSKIKHKPTFDKNIRLNKSGCKVLCARVIKFALIDKDKYFFESGNYLLYNKFLDNQYTAQDFIKFCDLSEEKIRSLTV